MKKYLTIILGLIAMLFVASCEEENPTIGFSKQVYALSSETPVDVQLVLSEPASSSMTVPVTFAGSAILGEDFTVSSQLFNFDSGSSEATITVTPKNNLTESSFTMSISAPGGYDLAEYATATVTVEAKETLILSFESATADVLDTYTAKVKVTGLNSGSNFVASEELRIPYTLEGNKDAVVIEQDAIVIAKGSNVGKLTIKAADLEDGDENEVSIAIDAKSAGARYALGTNASTKLTVKGVLKISKLLGTWTFDHVYDLEDVELFFCDEDMEDPDNLPTHNEGFTLTFSEVLDSDGNVTGYKLTPGGTGDFNNFYRESNLTYTSPIEERMAEGELTGPYTSCEMNMFVAMEDDDFEMLTWFELDKVNRAFAAGTEKLGKGVIAMRLTSAGLSISFKDYDQPPFGEFWWEDDDWDPDMWAFASLFTKVEE